MKKIFSIMLLLSACLVYKAGAQEAVNSGYFVESYNYRHNLNPAFASTRSYFALPFIGNFGLTTQSNVGISTFLYPYNGQLTTFMNGAVSADEFLGKLGKNNKLGLDLSMPVFSVGSWGKKGGFTTVGMSIKADMSFNMPYDLFDFMKNAGAKILTGCEAEDISVRKPAGEEQFFEIRCKGGQTFTCRRLIIATGGLSYPSTGSSGDGYGWAEETGHKISRRFPSLTAIVPRNYKSIPSGKDTRNAAESIHGHIDRSVPMSETGTLLNGNSLENISLTLWIDGNPVQEEFGDLDFTDGGIEGPVGFKVSRRCVNAIINGAKAAVSIDMKPAVRQEALEARVSKLWNEISEDRRSKGKQYKDKFRVLSGKLLPASLIPGFMKCNPGTDHKNIARALKAWKFDIAGFVGYERCVVTAGGVSAESVIAKTLESRLCSGLYFAGEVLDLDGDTGGYNLQIAWSTGYLAGINAAVREQSKIS